MGQQMVIVGRYDTPGQANIHLDGFASGNTVAMDFPFTLSGTYDESKLFVTKVWAQKAVEALVNEYYSYDPGTDEAQTLRDSLVGYSMCYGIGSPFTSFTADVRCQAAVRSGWRRNRTMSRTMALPYSPNPLYRRRTSSST